MKRIMVTGGTGLVGSRLEADIHLSSKDANLKNYSEVENLFKKLLCS